MPEINLRYLSGHDVAALELTDEEILAVVDDALAHPERTREMGRRLADVVHREHNYDRAHARFRVVVDEILSEVRR